MGSESDSGAHPKSGLHFKINGKLLLYSCQYVYYKKFIPSHFIVINMCAKTIYYIQQCKFPLIPLTKLL